MAQKLVGQNCAIQVTDQGAQDGTPASGSATDIKALVRSIRAEQTAETADVSALGDATRVIQVLRTASSIEVECFVPTTGEQFATMIGHYVKVEYKPIVGLSTFVSYSGVMTRQSLEMPDGAQIERFTVEGAAN